MAGVRLGRRVPGEVLGREREAPRTTGWVGSPSLGTIVVEDAASWRCVRGKPSGPVGHKMRRALQGLRARLGEWEAPPVGGH
jgi:hypothetical protein